MSKLMDEVKNALRVQGYALKTEQQYMNWIRRYVRHFLPKHPRETGVDGVREYVHLLGGAAVRSPLDRQFAPPVIRRALVES